MHHLFAAFILTLLFIPTIAFGAGLIPCGGAGEKECIACDFIKLGSNIINFLITIGAGIAVVLIAVAGLRMVMARGNMGEIEKAKAIFTNLVVGFIILLGAWLIVDTVLKTFAGSGQFGTWNTIQCVYPTEYFDKLKAPTWVDQAEQPTSGGVAVGGGAATGGGIITGGVGGGTCSIPSSGSCSPSALSAFGSQASNAAQICNAESSGNPGSMSGSDRISTGESFSVGLFQINLTVHELSGCTGGTLRCLDAFNGTNYSATISDRALYNKCVTAAKSASCNIANAKRIYNQSGSWQPWSTAKLCGL